LKNFITILFLLFLSIQSCYSQNPKTDAPPTRLYFSKERSDSLARNIPQAKGYINDFANLFTNYEMTVLDSLVSTYEKSTTVEIGVATVTSAMVKESDFEDYTLVMLRTWGIGKIEKNNGILIAISPDLKRMRIQNGYGIEKVLSDTETKEIIENSFIPRFKEGKYFEGTKEGILAIINKLGHEGL
jgi:uncharacterized protein